MVICQGCGQSFAVPAGYSRNKIQCSGCGVICAVPTDAGRGASAPKARATKATAEEDLAAKRLDDPAPAPLFDDEPEPIPRAAPLATPAKPADERVNCRRCGRLIARQRECPSCDDEVVETLHAETVAPTRSLSPLSLSLDDVEPLSLALDEDEEDESPYLLADKDIPLCPKCRKPMTIGAVLCTACGFDTKTRKKAKRTYEPIARSWDTGQTMRQRLMWFGVGQGFHWALALFLVLTGTSAWPSVVAWPLLTGLLLFVLGTCERVEIARDARGRVLITSTWRYAFFPVAPTVTEARGFEGVTTAQANDSGVIEWMIFVSLLCSGIIPAVVWWYIAIYKPSFHLALAIDHGHAEVYVYRGKSEEQMREIRDVLVNASGLRLLA